MEGIRINQKTTLHIINQKNIKDFLKEKDEFLVRREEKNGRSILTIILLIIGFLFIIS